MESKDFWNKVDKSDTTGCWTWLGGQNNKGYGDIWYKKQGSVRGCTRKAHRVAWELTNGAVPAGLCVLHHCDNRSCVNPAHLFIGTIADNNLDMWRKGRVKSGNRKLNELQVQAVRVAVGTLRAIATRFGISQRQVGRIRNGVQRRCYEVLG